MSRDLTGKSMKKSILAFVRESDVKNPPVSILVLNRLSEIIRIGGILSISSRLIAY